MDKVYDSMEGECSACGVGSMWVSSVSVLEGNKMSAGTTVYANRGCRCRKYLNWKRRWNTKCPSGAAYIFQETEV